MKIPKFLRLPTPKETGKSEYNSLPLEDFGAKPGDYTWNIYYNEMKKQYPIKYFLYRTLTRFFKVKIFMPLDDLRYWIKSHTIRKYHLLDIRNKTNNYNFGWIDCDSQLLYATMAIMENFIIEQDTKNRLIWLKEEENKSKYSLNDYNWNESIKFCENLLEIQKWWRVERPNKHKLLNDKYSLKFQDELYKEDTEMMKKLIDIRGGMWT